MNLVPTDVSTNVVIGICAIALISGIARGFSGFGSALIFMPLASSLAAPRLVAALLLIIDFIGAAPLLPNAWRQADRRATAVMVAGALVGGLGVWLGAKLFGTASEKLFRAICYALIAAAVIVGLPALDGVLR